VGLAKWQPTPREVNIPYWTLEPGWNTEVEIRNNLAERDLKVTPVLKLANGQEIPLNEVAVASEQVLSINLRSALAQVDPGVASRAGAFGSAVLRFNGLNAANLFAASLVQREGHPIEFHFDGFGSDPTSGSGGIEGIWWLPKETSTDYLVISNPSPNVVKGNLNLTSPSGPPRQIPLTIKPGQTTRVDVREALGASGTGQMGGLTLSLPDKELLSSSEIVFDETTGLAAMMKLFFRDTDERTGSHVLRAPMMALTQPDPALAFPEETTLVPRIFLWNASLSRLPVSVNIDWRTDNASGRYTVPPVRLSSGQVRVLDLSTFQDSGSIPAAARWSTITLGYTGRTADLVAVALSYDKSSRYGLQTPFTEGTSRLFKGSMWHVDASHNTLITTGNGGSEPTAAEVTLFYNEGKSKYRIEKSLSPGQQLWLNLGELIRNQVPDSDGRTIPPDTMSGSYELRDIDHALAGLLYEGKLIIDKTYGHAAYGCGSCCGYYDIVLVPAPFSGPPDDYFDDVIDATEQCGGYIDDVTDGGYNWKSSNTAVATLTSATLHTVAVGTATGSAQIQLQSIKMPACPQPIYKPTQPICVGSLGFSGTANNFIFVGTDPNILSANTYYLALASGTPTGGTYGGTSSDSSDTVTLAWVSSLNLEKATIQTKDQSTNVGDRTLTFTYTPPSCPALELTQNVTARQFAWVTNNSPGNTCSLGYGYLYNYVYTTYTHPDKAVVPAGVGLTNTLVTENFNPTTIACGNQPGNSSLDANSLFSDTIEVCSTSPLPTCSSTNTQTISIAGYQVRTNSLTIANTGLTYTSQGPTQ